MSTRKKQTGRSNKTADKKRKAKHPGVRTSTSGKKYSERRRNRSDVDRRKRL